MGCYISPNDASNLEDVVAAISRQPKGADILVDVDLNAKISKRDGTTHSLKTGVQEVDTSVARRQNTVTQFIATRPIMDLRSGAQHLVS